MRRSGARSVSSSVDETVTGRALDVDDAGGLLVATGTGVRTIHVGDVVHVR